MATASAGASTSGTSAAAEGADASTSAAKCGPTPAQLVDFNALAPLVHAGGIGAVQLAVGAANVSFVFGGALARVPLRGGPTSLMLTLPTNGVQYDDPVATASRVVLHVAVGNNDEEILSVPTLGGAATTLATSDGRVSAFTASETTVYFVDSSGLQSVPVTGGSVLLLSSAIGGDATGVAVVGSSIVVTMAGAVLSVPLQGGPMTTLATQQPNASFPMSCGTDVCWYSGATPSPSGPEGSAYIARLAAGGSVTTIPAQVYPSSLTFDGSNFFEAVGCDVCPGTLVRIAPVGAAQRTMVTAGFAAVDDECAYFSVAGGVNLPSADDGGIPGSGIYSVSKSYADPSL